MHQANVLSLLIKSEADDDQRRMRVEGLPSPRSPMPGLPLLPHTLCPGSRGPDFFRPPLSAKHLHLLMHAAGCRTSCPQIAFRADGDRQRLFPRRRNSTFPQERVCTRPSFTPYPHHHNNICNIPRLFLLKWPPFLAASRKRSAEEGQTMTWTPMRKEEYEKWIPPKLVIKGVNKEQPCKGCGPVVQVPCRCRSADQGQ